MVSFIRYRTLFRFYEIFQPYLQYSPAVETRLPVGEVLAIAPHPDDEAIGCGGTLALHGASGGRVSIVYCTSDGEPRNSEAKEASAVLGAARTYRLEYPVESLRKQKDLSRRLEEVISEARPEALFVPFMVDNHADHRAVNAALMRAWKRMRFSGMIYAYPVWSPLYPNVLLDVAAAWETKEKAIRCYRSQLATRDYLTMSRSLAQYWATAKGRGLRFVESFFRSTAGEYAALCEKMNI